jgi:hypothetical protein
MTSPYHGHDPQTPPGSEAALASISDALEDARQKLRRARDLEVAAKADRDAARRRARFAPDCPKAGVVDGVRTTVAYVEAWIEEQTAEEDLAYELARTARLAAGDHLHTLGQQGSLAQSLSRSVGQSYMGQR